MLEECAWGHTRRETQQMFEVLPGMLARAGIGIAAVDLFAAGLGPGSFSGSRMAVAAARAFALPGRKQAVGISSGEALAHDLLLKTRADTVVIVGNARRGQVWHAAFGRGNMRPAMHGTWALQPVDRLAAILPAGATVAGPDWDQLSDVLKAAGRERVCLVEENCYPSAAGVGTLAVRSVGMEQPVDGMLPIYLHPAVGAH